MVLKDNAGYNAYLHKLQKLGSLWDNFYKQTFLNSQLNLQKSSQTQGASIKKQHHALTHTNTSVKHKTCHVPKKTSFPQSFDNGNHKTLQIELDSI